MIDIGVARPSAQGQAMIRTATAATRAWGNAGDGPQASHATNAATATMITAGTNQPATLSASRWIGAWLRCAAATRVTIWASNVSRPTFSARITNAPVPLTEPATTRAPTIFSTGIDSPVSIDSSTLL